jgi:thiol peroxidase
LISLRKDEAFEGNEKLTVVGAKLHAGNRAPDVSLDYFDTSDQLVHSARIKDLPGRVKLLNVINSLDTPVCHVETKRWEKLGSGLPDGIKVYTVSMDLPFAQSRWCGAERVSHRSLSSHRSEEFGQKYGVLLKEWRLLQRAVFVISPDGHIAYAEYVPDQMKEPNYTRAVEAARRALG